MPKKLIYSFFDLSLRSLLNLFVSILSDLLFSSILDLSRLPQLRKELSLDYTGPRGTGARGVRRLGCGSNFLRWALELYRWRINTFHHCRATLGRLVQLPWSHLRVSCCRCGIHVRLSLWCLIPFIFTSLSILLCLKQSNRQILNWVNDLFEFVVY